MKALIASVLFILLFQFSNANPRIDSLENELTNEDLSKNVEILTKLVSEYRETDIDNAKVHADKAIKMAKKIGDKKNLAEAIRQLGIINAIQGEFDEAFEHFNKSLEISKSINYEIGKANAYFAIGKVQHLKGNHKSGIEKYMEALKLYEKNNYTPGLQITYNNLGWVYDELDNQPTALHYYTHALDYAKKAGDFKGIALSYNHLGNVYWSQYKFDKALEYYHQALRIINENNSDYSRSSILNNIGLVYDDKGELQKSFEYFRKSNEVSKNNSDTYDYFNSYINLTHIATKLKRFEDARAYLDSAESLAQKIGGDIAQADVYYYSAVYYQALKKHSKAKEFFKKAANLYYKIDNLKLHNRSLEHVGIEFAALGQSDSSTKYFRELIAFKDTVNRREKTVALNAIKAQTEIELEMKDVAFQQKLNEAHIQKLYIIISGLVLILFTVFIAIYYIRKKNKDLAQANEEIAESAQFQADVYNKLVSDVRQTLFPLSISIAKLNGTDEYEQINSHYLDFARQFDIVIKHYEKNIQKED